MVGNVRFFVHNADIRSEGEGRREAGWGPVWGLVLRLRTTGRELGGNNAENKPRPPSGGPGQLGSLVWSQGVSRGLSGDLREGLTPGTMEQEGSFRGRGPQAPRLAGHPGGLPTSLEDTGAWISPAPRGRGGLLEAGRGQSGGGLMMAPRTWTQSA